MNEDIALPYLKIETAKGNRYAYYRRGGQRQRIEGEIGSIVFIDNYTRIHRQFESGPRVKGYKPGSFNALVALYYRSAAYKALGGRARQEYRHYLDRFTVQHGDIGVYSLTRGRVIDIRDALWETPAAANNMVKAIRMLLNFAIDRELVTYNPAAAIKKLKTGDGWEAWPDAMIVAAHEKLANACRVAFMLALYTGQRKGDVLSMGWADIHGDTISVRQSKTGKRLEIPLHETLKAELSRVKRTGPAIVARRDGNHFTSTGFTSIWLRHLKRHDIANCQFHGLRRNAVKALLEAECTVPQTASVTGQSYEMVQRYAQQVSQELMAKQAMDRWQKSASGKQSGKLRIVKTE